MILKNNMEERFQHIPQKENTVKDLLSDPIEREIDRYIEEESINENTKVSNGDFIKSLSKEKKSNVLYYILLSMIVILGVFGIIVML